LAQAVHLCRDFTQFCISSRPSPDGDIANSSMRSRPLNGSASNANPGQSVVKLNSQGLERESLVRGGHTVLPKVKAISLRKARLAQSAYRTKFMKMHLKAV